MRAGAEKRDTYIYMREKAEREKRVSERERWRFYSLPSERGDGPFLSALPIVLRGCLLASAAAPKLQPHLECEHHTRIKAVCLLTYKGKRK